MALSDSVEERLEAEMSRITTNCSTPQEKQKMRELILEGYEKAARI